MPMPAPPNLYPQQYQAAAAQPYAPPPGANYPGPGGYYQNYRPPPPAGYPYGPGYGQPQQ